ncbi:hypothetical protein [Streptomyces sp. NPDC050504]|uniref:hypothetical protein n=1 Tax=Streptomyces sp. NPDC050504 TaxID=3365618 RepID=UPI0037AAE119
MIDTAGATYRMIGGALRNTGTGWGLINDAGHQPTGITAVLTRPDHIEIQHPVSAVKVSSFQVTPDETYAQQGLRVGISAGLALSRVYLYSGPPGLPPVDPSTVAAASGNLWLTGFLQLPTA